MDTAAEPIIRIRDVRRSYPDGDGGTLHAVDGVSLDFLPGEVTAVLGPNGAGKTTLIDMVLGLNDPSSGRIEVFGDSPRGAVQAGRVGALLQTGGLLPDLTVRETVQIIAALHRSRQRRKPHHVAGFIYAGVWTVFLVVPVIGIAQSGAPLAWQIFSCAATAAFGILYLALAWRWFTGFEEGRPPETPQLAAGVGTLALLAALSLPAAGSWVSGFTPYLAALVVYTRRPGVGIPAGLLLWAVPSLAAYALGGMPTVWVFAGPGIGMAFIVAMRLTEHIETRERRQEQQVRRAEERSSLARDVHDVLGHSLTVLHLKAQVARRMLDADPERAKAELAEIERLARDGLSQVRSTVTQLRPPELLGELDVARGALEAAGIEPRIVSERAGQEQVPPVLAWALREGVTNVLRHSGASCCVIEAGPDRVRVADDGAGLGESSEGNGLRGLRERAAAEGAHVVVGRAYPELEGTAP